MFAETIPYSAAFLAGLLSFFSPCILPLIPAYFSFITGYSLEELTDATKDRLKRNVVFSTLSYVTGFSIVFILMGATASFLGTLLFKYRDIIRIIGGILIIILGIHLAGTFRIPFLDVEKRISLEKKPLRILGALFVGMAFGVGWTPCIGPLLGSILVIAGNQQTVRQGIILLSVYSAGLAIPFIILSFIIHLIVAFVKRASRAVKYINALAGILLILMGLLLVTNKLNLLARSV